VDAKADTSPSISASTSAPWRLDALSWITLLVLVVIWGSTYAVVRIGVRTIDPAWLVAGRLGGATLAIAVWMIASRLLPVKPARDSQTVDPRYAPLSLSAILWFSLVGTIFNAVPLAMYATAAKTTGSAVLAICNGGTPIFTALAAHAVIRDDRLTPRRAIGVAMGFMGLLVLVGPELTEGVSASAISLTLAIVGAMFYAGSGIGTRLAPRISPMTSTLIIMASGAVLDLGFALFTAPFPSAPSGESLFAVTALALIPSALAFVIWVWLIQRTGAVFVSLTNYLMPLWAAGLGVVFLHETIGWPALAAMGLILAGVAVASRKPKNASDASAKRSPEVPQELH
jgi:drug/metabolite transporter (DMT)-like permease